MADTAVAKVGEAVTWVTITILGQYSFGILKYVQIHFEIHNNETEGWITWNYMKLHPRLTDDLEK